MKLSLTVTLLFSTTTTTSLISRCHGWTLLVPPAAPINHHAAAAVDAASSLELSSNYYHQSTESITKYAVEWLKENTLPQPAFAAEDVVAAAASLLILRSPWQYAAETPSSKAVVSRHTCDANVRQVRLLATSIRCPSSYERSASFVRVGSAPQDGRGGQKRKAEQRLRLTSDVLTDRISVAPFW